jgi:outer membrane protein TolC
VAQRATLENARMSVTSAQSDFDFKIVPSASTGFTGTGNDGNFGFSSGLALSRKFTPGTRISLGPIVSKTNGSYTSAMETKLEQPLLRGWGSDYNTDTLQGTRYQLQQEDLNLSRQTIAVLLDATSIFLDGLQQQKIINVNEQMLDSFRGQVQVAEAKEQAGITTSMDTFRARLRLKDVEDALTRAHERLRDNQDRLKLLLSLPVTMQIKLSDQGIPNYTLPSEEVAISKALEHRVEITQARLEGREADRRIALLKQSILPDLGLNLTYARSGSSGEFGNTFSLPVNTWGLSLQGSGDYYRTSEKTAYQQGLNNRAVLRSTHAALEEEIRKDVRTRLNATREAENRIAIRRDQLGQAEAKRELAGLKYSFGMGDNFDLIEALADIQRARLDLIGVEFERLLSQFQLQATMGILAKEGVVAK